MQELKVNKKRNWVSNLTVFLIFLSMVVFLIFRVINIDTFNKEEYQQIAEKISKTDIFPKNADAIICSSYIELICEMRFTDMNKEINVVTYSIKQGEVRVLIATKMPDINEQEMKKINLLAESQNVKSFLLRKEGDKLAFYANIDEKKINQNEVVDFVLEVIKETKKNGDIWGSGIRKDKNDNFIFLDINEIKEINEGRKKVELQLKEMRENNQLSFK